jgi:outer membrane protein assembly factor BamB
MSWRFGLLCAVVSLASARAEDWPRWRGPRGDGSWNGPAVPDAWPARLRRVWKQPMAGGYCGVFVSEGRVYTMDREKLTPATPESDGHERILCFDAATGRPLWSHRYPTRYGGLGGYSNGPRAAPTISDGRVYTLGAVGHFHCLDAATGKVHWSKDLVRDAKARIPEWGFAASPVIDEGRVIVHVGAEPDGCLIAFDRITGREVWRGVSDPAGYCTPVMIDSRGGRQLVVWTPENVRGLEPRTGRLLWTVPYKVTYGVSIASPIFREDILFVTGYWEGAKAIRLGPGLTDAELVWEDRRQLRGLMAQPLYRDGHVYSIDKQAGLVCFELKTGKKLWDDGNRMTPKGRNPHASMVWLGGGPRALVLNSAGELILARFEPTGYRELARTRILDGAVWSHPAFAGRCVFAHADGADHPSAGPNELVCVELPTEK